MTFPIDTMQPFRQQTHAAESALLDRHARVVRLMTSALAESRRQGHTPSSPAREAEGFGSFAYCTQCFRYICVDLDESKEPYGSGYTEPCSRGRKGKRL